MLSFMDPVQELKHTQEHLALQRHRKATEQTLKQNRKKFMDMEELLRETVAMEREDYQANLVKKSAIEIEEMMEGEQGVEFWRFVAGIQDLEIKVKGAEKFATIWKCMQPKDLLQTANKFLNKPPTLPKVKTPLFQDILSYTLSSDLPLPSFKTWLDCTTSLPSSTFLSPNILTLTQYLKKYSLDTSCLFSTLSLLSHLVNTLDENSPQTIQQISQYLSTVITLLSVNNTPILEITLTSISSCIYHGSWVVQFLISVGFIDQCLNSFGERNVKIRNLVVTTLHNTLLVCEKEQMKGLVERGLTEVVMLAIESEFSLDSLHLGLKMAKKVVGFVREIRNLEGEEGFVRMCGRVGMGRMLEVMYRLRKHKDEFVREEAASIRDRIEGILP